MTEFIPILAVVLAFSAYICFGWIIWWGAAVHEKVSNGKVPKEWTAVKKVIMLAWPLIILYAVLKFCWEQIKKPINFVLGNFPVVAVVSKNLKFKHFWEGQAYMTEELLNYIKVAYPIVVGKSKDQKIYDESIGILLRENGWKEKDTHFFKIIKRKEWIVLKSGQDFAIAVEGPD